MDVLSLAQRDGKSGRPMIVPRPLNERRSSNVKAYFLCDTAEYLLGVGSDKKRASNRYMKSYELHEEVLKDCNDFVARAVLKFYSRDLISDGWNAERLEGILETRKGSNKSKLIVFCVETSSGQRIFAHERTAIIDAWNSYILKHPESNIRGQCSVTGREATLARTFLQVSGLDGANKSGTSLVSFNCGSFNSYGKTQAYNASISEMAAFKAGTALRLLLTDAERCVHMGGTILTFWSDQPSFGEDYLMSHLFMEDKDTVSEDANLVRRIERALEGIKKGRPLEEEGFNPEVRYYVLGISPNVSRLSVRFFEISTLGELASCYGQYLRDIDMVNVQATSLFQLLRQCAVQGKYKNIPSTLVNPCVRAMLTEARFPQSLLSTLLSRMRSDHGSYEIEQKIDKTVGERVSLIKACLVRNWRLSSMPLTRESELDVSLNRNNNHVGYLLGRLFAVMEKAQQDAADGDLNSTIRDKYIGSASVTPARVMPTLMHGCQNHLGVLRKKKRGLEITLEKELDEIVGRKLSDNPYPTTLSMDEQGEFFIGYYQERVDLWTSHKQDGTSSDITQSNDNFSVD